MLSRDVHRLVIRRRHRSISVLELRATAPSIPQLSNHSSRYPPTLYCFKRQSYTFLYHISRQSLITPPTVANMKPVVSIMHAWSWYVLPTASPHHLTIKPNYPAMRIEQRANDMNQHNHLRLRYRDPLRPRRSVQRKPSQPDGQQRRSQGWNRGSSDGIRGCGCLWGRWSFLLSVCGVAWGCFFGRRLPSGSKAAWRDGGWLEVYGKYGEKGKWIGCTEG